ncbi:Hypothetical_protein [Hexamita inflata]|uniref:Hypothetical_protein n=1 Tax=Hexamita inflata TaxID=28002 RepID=A0ABP1HRE0_9EUKA
MSKYHQARPTSASQLKVETSRLEVISMVTSTKNSCEELGSCHIDIILIADENAAEKVKNVHLMKIIKGFLLLSYHIIHQYQIFQYFNSYFIQLNTDFLYLNPKVIKIYFQSPQLM